MRIHKTRRCPNLLNPLVGVNFLVSQVNRLSKHLFVDLVVEKHLSQHQVTETSDDLKEVAKRLEELVNESSFVSVAGEKYKLVSFLPEEVYALSKEDHIHRLPIGNSIDWDQFGVLLVELGQKHEVSDFYVSREWTVKRGGDLKTTYIHCRIKEFEGKVKDSDCQLVGNTANIWLNVEGKGYNLAIEPTHYKASIG
ncbi:hypothetical protein N9Y92_02375 [Chlamydiales bacterium]|nr:hypothetical protein [Chlamydiales bacterium]